MKIIAIGTEGELPQSLCEAKKLIINELSKVLKNIEKLNAGKDCKLPVVPTIDILKIPAAPTIATPRIAAKVKTTKKSMAQKQAAKKSIAKPVTKKPTATCCLGFSDKEQKTILSLRKSGLGIKAIARKIKRSDKRVSKFLKTKTR